MIFSGKYFIRTAFILSCFLYAGCDKKIPEKKARIFTAADFFTDTTAIPHDTIPGTDHALVLNDSGIYYYKAKPFSGIIKSENKDHVMYAFTSVLEGKRHGTYRSYYSNGSAFEVRQYRNNMATGRHYGYWENGNMKFDYLYFEEKKSGYFNKWFPDGKPYIFSNYTDDKEDGLQRGWRPNGKLFLNYVAKDGHTYGLQETALCYTLENEKLKK